MVGSESIQKGPKYPQEGHVNTVQEQPHSEFEPSTLILQGKSANHCIWVNVRVGWIKWLVLSWWYLQEKLNQTPGLQTTAAIV